MGRTQPDVLKIRKMIISKKKGKTILLKFPQLKLVRIAGEDAFGKENAEDKTIEMNAEEEKNPSEERIEEIECKDTGETFLIVI